MSKITFENNMYVIEHENGKTTRIGADDYDAIVHHQNKKEQYMEIDFHIKNQESYCELTDLEKDRIIENYNGGYTGNKGEIFQWEEAIEEYLQDREREFWVIHTDAGLTEERYDQLMERYGYDINIVAEVINECGIELCNKGYDIFDYEGTGLLEIDRIDSVGCFKTVEDAVSQAEKDGIRIIPVDELPENFERGYYGWIDTPENRNAIKDYCLRNVVPEAVVNEEEIPKSELPAYEKTEEKRKDQVKEFIFWQ